MDKGVVKGCYGCAHSEAVGVYADSHVRQEQSEEYAYPDVGLPIDAAAHIERHQAEDGIQHPGEADGRKGSEKEWRHGGRDEDSEKQPSQRQSIIEHNGEQTPRIACSVDDAVVQPRISQTVEQRCTTPQANAGQGDAESGLRDEESREQECYCFCC